MFKNGGGGVSIKLKFRKGKEEGEIKENKEEVMVKEVDLGDGTRKMLKFEKKESSSEETESSKEREEQQDVTVETKEKEITPAPVKEEDKQSQPQVPATNISPNLDKQLSKLEVEISKNRDMIKDLENRIENLNKDLDDLVSLYEIVSEQMNPFVGLSKVTKQRLEALEKFTEEFEKIKSRLEDLEILVGKIPTDRSTETTGMVAEVTPTLSDSSMKLDDVVEKAISTLMLEDSIDDMIDRFLEEVKNE